MSRLLLPCVMLIAVASCATHAPGPTERVINTVIPGTSTVVVVAEGELEPRSMGSYSVRTYAGSDPRFPYDRFIAGIVRPRDGTIERVLFSDLDHDGHPEIIVVTRSAGSGDFLCAEAFSLRITTLSLFESACGLPKDADPVSALEGKLRGAADPGHAKRGHEPRR